MSTSVRDLVQRRRRLRRVVEHIGGALAGPLLTMPDDDDALSLRTLAAVACWSPEHFDRVYRQTVGEPPLTTVRRLRLRRAAQALLQGGRLVDVADAAGYGSTQAFGRAFARQHGQPPLQWLARQLDRRAAEPPAPLFTSVALPDGLHWHLLDYQGPGAGVSDFFDRFIDRLVHSGSPRAQWQVFGVSRAAAVPGAWDRRGGDVSLSAAVLGNPLTHAPVGLATAHVAPGPYARVALEQATNPLLADALHDAGWQRTDGPVLRHYDTDPAQTVAPERREWLYLPLARR
ncbi:AraC family transcriptional regulator [Ideonella sp. BN130291]|uniref:AraC family transcriptional regulator n=1 Tax=Ideonella sp. BN130291 TaxID=3112940 RepID=UPI002E257C76|nr:AraC family transcriptional regulator [Ideonella sp. BN130291]